MRLIQPKRGFFSGERFHSPAEGPVEIPDGAATILVRQGLAEFVSAIEAEADGEDPTPFAAPIETADLAAPARARKAVAKRA